jgi:hypothetical protein
LGHYNDLLTFNFRVLVDGPIWGPLFYSVDLTGHSLPFREEGTFAVEHMGLVSWRINESFAMQAAVAILDSQMKDDLPTLEASLDDLLKDLKQS